MCKGNCDWCLKKNKLTIAAMIFWQIVVSASICYLALTR